VVAIAVIALHIVVAGVNLVTVLLVAKQQTEPVVRTTRMPFVDRGRKEVAVAKKDTAVSVFHSVWMSMTVLQTGRISEYYLGYFRVYLLTYKLLFRHFSCPLWRRLPVWVRISYWRHDYCHWGH
jgi:hypothetical protein